MSDIPRIRRVLLKISGEAFCPAGERGIIASSLLPAARQIARAAKGDATHPGIGIGIVMGGGNILRGGQFVAQDGNQCVRIQTAHYMGMLATMMNGLALRDALEYCGAEVRLLTAVRADAIAEAYTPRRAQHYLEGGRIVVLAGGTGGPYVTTDTAAAMRAIELECDLLLKATKVDGVYSDDPEKNPSATRFETISYDEMLERRLRIIDLEATIKCREHGMKFRIFNCRPENALLDALRGKPLGTLVE
ncbi:MAG: uridine monophosphate kinase [Thermoguttaceae bacterium]|nr:uridine monophosphate kinase [Thermoguttaceae bacterium]